ncbi:MAG: alkane 1-monooxygenase [Bacteroidota bacterium]
MQSRYFLSLLPTIFAIFGNLAGGYFAASNIIFSLGFLVVIDWILPQDKRTSGHTNSTLPDAVLLVSVLFHTLGVATLLYAVYSGILFGKFIWLAAVSTGFAGGILGITAGHELIHREKQPWMQYLGIWNLFIVGYTHFFTEHQLVHHVKVGTREDAATARYGESLYAFLVRSIPNQWVSALQTDARLQQKRNKAAYGWGNFTLRATVLQMIWCLMLGLVLGKWILLAYLVQSVAAFFLLEYVNYIEHYGLERREGERVGKQHAWQSDAVTSRFTLFELSRHADHHMRASKPYYTLESHAESPTLPAGYFGMFYLALFPPLFFRVVHPHIRATTTNKSR